MRVNSLEGAVEAIRLELGDAKDLLGSALDRIELLEAKNAAWDNQQGFEESLGDIMNERVNPEGVPTFELASGGATPRQQQTEEDAVEFGTGRPEFPGPTGSRDRVPPPLGTTLRRWLGLRRSKRP